MAQNSLRLRREESRIGHSAAIAVVPSRFVQAGHIYTRAKWMAHSGRLPSTYILQEETLDEIGNICSTWHRRLAEQRRAQREQQCTVKFRTNRGHGQRSVHTNTVKINLSNERCYHDFRCMSCPRAVGSTGERFHTLIDMSHDHCTIYTARHFLSVDSVPVEYVVLSIQ